MNLVKYLGGFNINKLNIISINNKCKSNIINVIRTHDDSLVMYSECILIPLEYFLIGMIILWNIIKILCIF